MEETRTIHELLIILRDNAKVRYSWFGFKQRIEAGLCFEIDRLYGSYIIDQHERNILIYYIYDNRPNKEIGIRYFWPMGNWKPRLKWLNKHIELTSNK